MVVVSRLPVVPFGELACVGRDDEAQAAVQKVLLLVPELSLATVRLSLSSTDPDLAERAVDALRKAGLPE